MKINQTIISCFSPTRTSLQVARAIAQGVDMSNEIRELDATYQSLEKCTITDDRLLIVSVPVYGSAVAPIALKRLEALHGEGTPAVVVTLYGNRDFGNAPAELAAFLKARGFCVIAAAAFVGEHSYSTPETPIAVGRPNAGDLEEARAFGAQIAQKLKQAEPAAVDASNLVCPKSGLVNTARFAAFIVEYKHQMQKNPVKIVPVTDAERCLACGQCVDLCPTGAIPADNPAFTDPEKCIKCAACVKGCPQNARKLNTPFAQPLSQNFKKPKNNVTIL